MEKYKNQLQDTVIIPMNEFMTDYDDCGFTEKDIAKCESLILKYFAALEEIKVHSDKEIMENVKSLVLSLNKLNEKTNYCLIETEEREAICEIIQSSAIESGLSDSSDDITEQWREW